jgi:hypothetical protein
LRTGTAPHSSRRHSISQFARLPRTRRGCWGCGEWHGSMWFQVRWSEATSILPIAVKEFLPILIGCAIWGARWSNDRVVGHCDNQAVVASLRSRTSRHPVPIHLLPTWSLSRLPLGFTWPLNTSIPMLTIWLMTCLVITCPPFSSRCHMPLHPLPGADSIGGPSTTGGVGISAMAQSVQSYSRQGLAESEQQ